MRHFLMLCLLTFALLPVAVPRPGLAAEPVAYLASALGKPALVGEGRLRLMLWDVYDLALYAPSGTYKPDRPAALVYSYLRNVKGATVADASRDEIRRLGMTDPAKLKDWHAQLLRLMPDAQKGTVLAAVHLPGRETQFYKDGKKVGTIADPEFGNYFFKIWLSPQTKEPALRRKLLGGS